MWVWFLTCDGWTTSLMDTRTSWVKRRHDEDWCKSCTRKNHGVRRRFDSDGRFHQGRRAICMYRCTPCRGTVLVGTVILTPGKMNLCYRVPGVYVNYLVIMLSLMTSFLQCQCRFLFSTYRFAFFWRWVRVSFISNRNSVNANDVNVASNSTVCHCHVSVSAEEDLFRKVVVSLIVWFYDLRLWESVFLFVSSVLCISGYTGNGRT